MKCISIWPKQICQVTITDTRWRWEVAFRKLFGLRMIFSEWNHWYLVLETHLMHKCINCKYSRGQKKSFHEINCYVTCLIYLSSTRFCLQISYYVAVILNKLSLQCQTYLNDNSCTLDKFIDLNFSLKYAMPPIGVSVYLLTFCCSCLLMTRKGSIFCYNIGDWK